MSFLFDANACIYYLNKSVALPSTSEGNGQDCLRQAQTTAFDKRRQQTICCGGN